MSERDYLPGCFANRLPMPSESFPGFMLRTAEANAYAGIGEFLSNVLQCDQPRTPETLARLCLGVRTDGMLLSRLGRVVAGDAHCLDRYAFEPLHDEAVFAHSCRIDLDALLRTQAQVCPLCLTERNCVLEEWDLAPVTCCPTHGVYLLNACGRCGTELSWMRSSLFGCPKCGVDLRGLDAAEAPPGECVASEDFSALAPFRLRLEDGRRLDAIWDTAFRIVKSLTFGPRWFREGEWPARNHFASLAPIHRREALRHFAGIRRNDAYDVWLLRPHFARALAPLDAIPKKELAMEVTFQLLFTGGGLPREVAASMSDGEQQTQKPSGAQLFGGKPPSFNSMTDVRDFLGADESTFTQLLRLGIVHEPVDGAAYDIDELLAAQSFLAADLLTVADVEHVAGVPLDWDDIRQSTILPRWNPSSSLDPRVAVDVVCDLQLRLAELLSQRQAPSHPVLTSEVLVGCPRPLQSLAVLLNELLSGRLERFSWSYPYKWAAIGLDADELDRISFNCAEGSAL